MHIMSSPRSPWRSDSYQLYGASHLPPTIDPALLSPPQKRRRLTDDGMSQSEVAASSTAEADPAQDQDQNEDWSAISDPSERRRVQNRLAQRKFRAKNKEQKEERERDLQNQERAASSYSTPEPGEIESSSDLSGLPWGGPSLSHVISAGKEKERSASISQAGSLPLSLAGVGSPASQTSQGGTSSRIGLQLSQRFARGGYSSNQPAWRYPAWRYIPYTTRLRPPVPRFADTPSSPASTRATASPRRRSSTQSQP